MAALLKVGELAEKTGVSVRTLHHYEEIGLLVPSHRTSSNHRLYTTDDAAKLQRIVALRQLGFGLDAIARMLAEDPPSPLAVIEEQLSRARQVMALHRRMVDRLEALAASLRRDEPVGVDSFLETIEVMTMWERELTDEQKDEVRARARELGPAMAAIEGEWLSLLGAVRSAMERGVDPQSPEVFALVDRLRATTRTFAGDRPSIAETLTHAYRAGAGAEHGLDDRLRAYMAAARR